MIRARTNLTFAISLLASLIFIAAGVILANPAMAKNPYAKPDDSWISISGTVESVTADSFILDYGDGVITVEMDDGDRDADGYKLLAGDKVTVNGLIDDDFYETTTIEASSVYVEKLGTTFFASAVDEEDYLVTVTTPIVVSATTVQGTVTAVDDEEFTVATGLQATRVDVEEMAYNPLDMEGYQRIEVGDYVRVTGNMEKEFFEGRELMAETVVELVD
ncbi:MAG TPA: hypothetical protein VJ910_05790 [Desulfuromonadales bacterium]|nr:hypothetical protein [Desulfuromonadales bacterium]